MEPVEPRSKFTVSKPCNAAGCGGKMFFHERMEVADAPHTLEWPWYASWRCDQDSRHVELISHEEERDIRWRERTTRARSTRQQQVP
jgi:hypothetical protein